MGMAMLGDRISAEQAADWGLIWKCVDDDQLDAEVAAATDILKRTSLMQWSAFDNRWRIDVKFVDQLAIEMEHQSVLIPRNMAEGAQAFLEKATRNSMGVGRKLMFGAT